MKAKIKKELLKRETDNYVLYENKNYGFTIESLAKDISKYLNTKFLLYREDDVIYTDNEYVLQILKYEVGFLSLGDEKLILKDLQGRWLVNEQLKVSFNFLVIEEDENLKFKKYNFKVKWYYLYSVIYEMLYIYLKNLIPASMRKNVSKSTYGEKLYNLFSSDIDFIENNEWINKFKNLQSIDPLHLYISFNYAKQKDDFRKKRIKIILKVLNNKLSILSNGDEDFHYFHWHTYKLLNDIEKYSIDFDGCPMPMAASILSARNKEDQEVIIENFFKFQSSDDIDFLKIKEVFGVDIASFTIFMFWCKPLNYISLDKNNRLLLEKNNKIQNLPKTYQEYKQLLDGDKKLLYVNLSKIAVGIKKINDFNKYEQEEIKRYLNIFTLEDTKIEFKLEKTNFEIIALKILEESDQKYYKNLLKNHYYLFNHSYKFLFNYNLENETGSETIVNLYKNDNVNVSISAIVGKNGSGKSTVAEVLYGFIYNLSIILKATEEMASKTKINLFAELIYRHNKIYKIVLKRDELKIYKYQEDNNEENNSKWINISTQFDLNDFFYTIAVNYSIYANNSVIVGDWIDTIFHKNDAYQTPIVIEPYRNKGNIDINRQLELAKQRLLINLLKPVFNIKNSIRKLRESKKYSIASKVKLIFNSNKIVENKNAKIKDEYIFKNEDEGSFIKYADIKKLEDIIKNVANTFQLENFEIEFDINKTLEETSFIGKIQLYIVKKIVTMVNRYEIYEDFKNFNNILELIEKIYNDQSHITFKLKRAIYFLKYEELLEKKEEILFNIEEYSNRLVEFWSNHKDLLFHQITPPSFYDIDIFLGEENDYINFNDLSSGEKQRILGINSLIYHLENLNYSSNNNFQYKYVNIILDEIELYYHPQFQIEHIKYILRNIEKTDLDNISGINFIFITHSPFILTDIVDNNILFLNDDTDDEKTYKVLNNTFGANIYDIFEKGFFLENSIGKISEEWIKVLDLILSFFNAYKLANEDNVFPLRNLLKRWYFVKNENRELSEEEMEKQDKKLLSEKKEELLKDLFEKNEIEYKNFKFLIDEEFNLKPEIEDYINIIGDEIVRNHLLDLYKRAKNESE